MCNYHILPASFVQPENASKYVCGCIFKCGECLFGFGFSTQLEALSVGSTFFFLRKKSLHAYFYSSHKSLKPLASISPQLLRSLGGGHELRTIAIVAVKITAPSEPFNRSLP